MNLAGLRRCGLAVLAAWWWALFSNCAAATAAAAVAAPPPASVQPQKSSIEHRLKQIDKSIDLWERAPAGWNGLRPSGTQRFLTDLGEVLAIKEAAPSSWGLALRAAALASDARESTELQSLAMGAKGLLDSAMKRDPRARQWATIDILSWDSSRTLPRRSRGAGSLGVLHPSTKARRIILSMLKEGDLSHLRSAILMIARRDSDPLRFEAFKTLSQWAAMNGGDDVIDLFLVKQLGRVDRWSKGVHPVNVVMDRIYSTDLPLAARAQKELSTRIATMVISADWKKAAIGMRLARGLSVEERVPVLLDALSVWHQRSMQKKEHRGLTRIQGDLVRALRKLSGMRFGPQPPPWIDWWVAVKTGKRPMPGTPEFVAAAREKEDEQRSVSRASFFGLKPETDSVTFIIDHSGSMASNWGTTSKTRYEEAVDQMMRFLQASPEGTRFNVILFSSEPLRSSPGLVEATPENLEKARTSLLKRTPEGGTNLRPAVRLALAIGEDGLPDVDQIEADTVVVLCDGATSEGAGWVQPFLTRALPLAPVVFHTVLVGPSNDGALSELADISGGEFGRVGG